jgi:hypothetical protein
MKLNVLLAAFTLISSVSASAATSSLFVKEGSELIDVQTLINDETDVYATYGFDGFCYQGDSQAVIAKMKKWASATDYFFSGGGGGFVLKKITLIRGFVSYDLQMVLEDEVVPGEFKSIMIKPCSFKK